MTTEGTPMALNAETRKKLARLAARDRAAQEKAAALREEFLAALKAARETEAATVREIAEVVGLSHQRVHELTTVRNHATARKAAAREAAAVQA